MKCVIYCDVMLYSSMFLSAATAPAVTVIGKQFRGTTPAVTVIGNKFRTATPTASVIAD